MIQITHSTGGQSFGSKIFLISQDQREVSGMDSAHVASFQHSEKKFEYFKSSEGFTFLVKSDQKAEELRVLGNTIEGLIFESCEGIELLGEQSDALYALAEGLLLSATDLQNTFPNQKAICFNPSLFLMLCLRNKSASFCL